MHSSLLNDNSGQHQALAMLFGRGGQLDELWKLQYRCLLTCLISQVKCTVATLLTLWREQPALSFSDIWNHCIFEIHHMHQWSLLECSLREISISGTVIFSISYEFPFFRKSFNMLFTQASYASWLPDHHVFQVLCPSVINCVLMKWWDVKDETQLL
jgi:hypothetical protein